MAAGTATITVQAKTISGGTPESLTKTVAVAVKEQVATPVITFEPSTTDNGATAKTTITCATEGAVIYYTINSDDPTPTTSAKKKDTKKFFLDATTAGASACRKNIVWEDLYKQTLYLPKDELEQQKLASYLTSLTNQITLQTQRLEKLKQIKSACLDNMFV